MGVGELQNDDMAKLDRDGAWRIKGCKERPARDGAMPAAVRGDQPRCRCRELIRCGCGDPPMVKVGEIDLGRKTGGRPDVALSARQSVVR